jgi:hypothetical protein
LQPGHRPIVIKRLAREVNETAELEGVRRSRQTLEEEPAKKSSALAKRIENAVSGDEEDVISAQLYSQRYDRLRNPRQPGHSGG